MRDYTVITEYSGQFRITIPKSIIKQMKLRSGDVLDWTIVTSKTVGLSKMIKATAFHKEKKA